MPTSLGPTEIEETLLGGNPAEIRNAIGCTAMAIDFTNHSVTVSFLSGAPADNTFTPSTHGTPYWTTIDTISGNWISSTGASGTLTGPQLATMNGNLKNARNGSEALANSLGVLPGTIVAWS